jgi:hypothetical protein
MKAFWNNKELNSILDFLQKLAFAIGIPVSIYTYILTYQKEREDAEYFIYDKMDEKTWDYEKLAMQYSELGLSDAVVQDTTLLPFKPDSLFTKKEKLISRNLMYLIISMYERAYIMYSDGGSGFKQRQWVGWEQGMKRWVANEQFQKTWIVRGVDFDSNFQKYVNDLMEANEHHD